jgi:hypothetical protein
MSSWTSLQAGKRIPVVRGGYYQDIPQGTFVKKTLPATVVSAYYDCSTKKHSQDKYREWIKNFLSLPTHLVFFCEESFQQFVWENRKEQEDRTTVVVVPREDWNMRLLGDATFWKTQAAKDPDNRLVSEDVMILYLEKKEFVKRAIAMNPYKHTDFVWCDAGAFRQAEFLPYFQEFPNANRIPTERMLIGNVMPFTRSDEKSVVISFSTTSNVEIKGGNFQRPRVAGGLLAGSIDTWEAYDTLFNSALKTYLGAGWFIGNDQNMIANTIILNKDFWSLVDGKPIYWDPWFCAFAWLSVSDKMISVLLDKKQNGSKRSAAEFLKLLVANTPSKVSSSVQLVGGAAAAAAQPRPLRQVVLVGASVPSAPSSIPV